MELGETTDARELIPGDSSSLRSTADTLTRFGNALVQAGGGLRGIDDGGWRGDAAEAFHTRFGEQPSQWLSCGDAFHSASGALQRYAATLDCAQGEAQRAITMWQQGQKATAKAKAAYQQQVTTIREQAASGRSVSVPAFVDPGEGMRSQAQDIVCSARSQLASVGDEATTTVKAATRQAPHKPSWWSSAFGDVEDALGTATRDVGNAVYDVGFDVAAGLGRGVRGIGDGLSSELRWAGNATGIHALDSAGDEVRDALQGAGDEAENAVSDTASYARNEMYDRAQAIDGNTVPVTIKIDTTEYPAYALHVFQAQNGMSWHGDEWYEKYQPSILTINRAGSAANRAASLAGIPTKRGYDRDEYPPAMFHEGGAGASVKYINAHDNRGAGNYVKNQATGLGNGEQVRITVS